jgi:protein TonB
MKKILFIATLSFMSVYLTAQNSSSLNSQVSVQREAQFPGGDTAMIRYVYENMHWPESIKGNVINDQCMISLDVRPDSSVINLIFLKKVGYGIDEQIAELLKRKKFIPSIQNNIPVKMNIMLTIPIQYRKK